MKNVPLINPLSYKGWDDLIGASEGAGIFYTSFWARVVSDTYGFRPLYLTCIEEGKIKLLMPFMEVRSLITGNRAVSLPFTDRCDSIFESPDLFLKALEMAKTEGVKRGWRYLEWRGGAGFPDDIPASEVFFEHILDLSRPLDEIFASLRESNKRNIRKAMKAGLEVKLDSSMDGLTRYHRLHCKTRREHGLPPQPFSFFRNLHRHIVSAGHGFTALCLQDGLPIAGAVFLHFGNQAIYKYGASEKEHQHLRPNNLIMWEAIRHYCDKGFQTLSLGRTELENEGLLQFKRGWGAAESTLKYYRYSPARNSFVKNPDTRLTGWHNKVFRSCPIPILRLIGSLLYRHIA